eukprot:Colp12_sorted_trinity150504_noHs@22901
MPNRCCVPHCTGNHKGHDKGDERVRIFKWPTKEPLRSLWKQQVPRDWTEAEPVDFDKKFVCIKHFERTDFEWYTKDDPSKLSDRPRLKKNVVPTIFPGDPRFGIVPDPVEPEDTVMGVANEQERLESFEQVRSYVSEHANELGWTFKVNPDALHLCLTDIAPDDTFYVKSSIKIHRSRHLEKRWYAPPKEVLLMKHDRAYGEGAFLGSWKWERLRGKVATKTQLRQILADHDPNETREGGDVMVQENDTRDTNDMRETHDTIDAEDLRETRVPIDDVRALDDRMNEPSEAKDMDATTVTTDTRDR